MFTITPCNVCTKKKLTEAGNIQTIAETVERNAENILHIDINCVQIEFKQIIFQYMKSV